MIGRPAASADVHPAGRSAFEFRSKMAPESAVQLEACGNASYSSYRMQLVVSIAIACRSPVELLPPSIGAFSGTAYGPGSLSSAYRNVGGIFRLRCRRR